LSVFVSMFVSCRQRNACKQAVKFIFSLFWLASKSDFVYVFGR
jgi:hypothetical protein